jgi:hypothetical protein
MDLLPFPDEMNDGARRISPATARILQQLQREGKLPSRVQAEAGQFLIEAEKINR